MLVRHTACSCTLTLGRVQPSRRGRRRRRWRRPSAASSRTRVCLRGRHGAAATLREVKEVAADSAPVACACAGVLGLVVVNADGIPIRTTMDNASSVQARFCRARASHPQHPRGAPRGSPAALRPRVRRSTSAPARLHAARSPHACRAPSRTRRAPAQSTARAAPPHAPASRHAPRAGARPPPFRRRYRALPPAVSPPAVRLAHLLLHGQDSQRAAEARTDGAAAALAPHGRPLPPPLPPPPLRSRPLATRRSAPPDSAPPPPQNELKFIRLRSLKHEIMVAPDNEYLLVIVQDPSVRA